MNGSRPAMKKRKVAASLLAAVLATATGPAAAQVGGEVYPVRPIRFVIGGGPDTLARVVGQKLTEAWGQQTVIDQRGGGAAAISADVVAKAKPDGYTLLLATSTHATHMVTPGQITQTYDLIRDFSPVTLAASTAFILSVHPSLPVKSVSELVRFAKAHPGKLNYASAGSGSPPQSSAKRSPFAPHMPTVAEAGVPGFDTSDTLCVIAFSSHDAEGQRTLQCLTHHRDQA